MKGFPLMKGGTILESKAINKDIHQGKEDLNNEDVKTSVFKDFLALIKIGIINSNIITAITGMWLALFYNGLNFLPYLDKVIFATIGVWLVIAGSCALNNYIDIDIDTKMKRTQKRPTVTGNFTPTFALTIGLSFVTIGLLFLFTTSVTAGLVGAFGSFVYVVLYSMWTKRKYTINTVVGAFSGAVPPLIGWAAIDPDLHTVAWVLFIIMFIWQIPHFLALAMKKTDDYRTAGIPMLPVVYGNEITKRQTLVWVACLLPLPIFLVDLGIVFVALATMLNIGWLVLGFVNYKKDDMKWATKMFVYSLNYLTILFTSMVILAVF